MNYWVKGVPTEVLHNKQFIDGSWVSDDGDRFVRDSPAHGVPVSTIQIGRSDHVENAITAARSSFEKGAWSKVPAADRAELLRKAASKIADRREELAYWETLETGKPYQQSLNEVDGSVELWNYAAGQAQTIHGETFDNFGDGSLGFVLREPVGVVGLITPWNFPLFILSERLPFILASGNSVVVKPSEFTSTTTITMAEILNDLGMPNGVLNVVTGFGDPVGSTLLEHEDVDMVSFTGSTRVGQIAMKAAAKNIKKLSLELGGKNPVVVLPDADLDKAADGIVYGICFNAGQCCVSGSRLIVHESIKDALIEKIVALLKNVRVGDPFEPGVHMGPIVNSQQMNRILDLIASGSNQGGKLVHGGNRTGSELGHFVEPTVFCNVEEDMWIAKEEIFGPVLSVFTFESEDEAIHLANATEFGLSATVWTQGLDTGFKFMRKIKAGRVWVNTTITGGPEMPIGGYKQSGLGRETGLVGAIEYTETKSAIVDLGDRKSWV
ncbi:Betaine aldehyde dehydrogenase [Roseibium album]|nr:Betaine aldehyde dehydrogenase [Roseibium album]